MSYLHDKYRPKPPPAGPTIPPRRISLSTSASAAYNELQGVPDFMRLFSMMALGYPDGEPVPKKMRGLDKMIHLDECAEGDFRTPDEVKAFCTPS